MRITQCQRKPAGEGAQVRCAKAASSAASSGHLQALCKQVHCICRLQLAAVLWQQQQQRQTGSGSSRQLGSAQLQLQQPQRNGWENGVAHERVRSAFSPHVLLLVLEGEGRRVVALNHRGALRKRKGQCQREQQCALAMSCS